MNDMKKNKVMRLASSLLVAALLTTSAVSGTFAKYVTSTNGTDTARVAYWGFDQDAMINLDLFDTSYTHIKSGNNDNVVAPGQSKDTTFQFGYTNYTTDTVTAPEVDYTFKVDVVATGSYSKLDANSDFTWSLKKTKGGSETVIGTYQTVALLEAAIENLSGNMSGTQTYEAGNLPDNFTAADETYTVGWSWTYVDGTTSSTQDATDTAMGNAETLDDVELTITVTATQID